MAYISRSRSLSVSTVPFTLATGLPVGTIGAICAGGNFPVVVGACEATCAGATTVAVSKSAVMKRYFMVPLCFPCIKKGERIAFPPGTANQCLLELGGDGVGVVSFVGFAKVALTAELRGGRRGLASRVRRDIRVVRTVHEEERGVVAGAIASDLAGRR